MIPIIDINRNQAQETILELKKVFKIDNFNFSFTCAMYLSGDSKKQLRREIIKQLTGEEKPASKCGLYATEDALKNSFVQYKLF